jgi:uncharacterized protein (TIGR03437 family)
MPPTIAGGAIARGTAFSIRGVRFASGAVVSVQKDNVTTPVRVVSIDPERIDAVMPETAPLGPASLVVRVGASASKPAPIEIAASNPGIFSQNKRGWGPGRIENIEGGKRVLNSAANPAHPGLRVAVKITGLGRVPAMVVVGNRTVNAGLARRLPEAGVQEISFVVPPDTPLGCYVPVYLLASPTRASNVVTMAVAPPAGECDTGPVPLLNETRIGLIAVTRSSVLANNVVKVTDDVVARFAAKEDGPFLSPLLLLPPPGTCTEYTSSFQATVVLPISFSNSMVVAELGNNGLAAGSRLSIVHDNNQQFIPWDRGAIGYYRARLKSRPNQPRLLDRGKLILSGSGGMDVGPFQLALESPAPFEWTSRDRTQIVDRSRPLPFDWRGQPANHWMVLLATNVDQITTAIGTCVCTAPLNATHFEIPAAMLANIPASIDTPGVPYDQLFVASFPDKASPLIAKGLGAGVAVTIYANGRYVRYH